MSRSGSYALAGGFSESIGKALAIPASNATGTIRDVKHVVILMQEKGSSPFLKKRTKKRLFPGDCTKAHVSSGCTWAGTSGDIHFGR